MGGSHPLKWRLLIVFLVAPLSCHYAFSGAGVTRILERNAELERRLGRSEGENRILRERCAPPGTLILRLPPRQPLPDAGLPDAAEQPLTY